jgi:hypothetical protein
MIKEHDQVALTVPVPEFDLEPGDVGTVVFIYGDHEAYEVEFFSATGETIAVVGLDADQVRPVSPTDRLQVRPLNKTA